MGYYSDFNFEVFSSDGSKEIPFKEVKVAFVLKEDEFAALNLGYIESSDEFVSWIKNSNNMKWYDCEVHMKQISKLFPEFLFKIHRTGEESGDIEDLYFLDGKMQSCQAEWKIEPFDHSKLR